MEGRRGDSFVLAYVMVQLEQHSLDSRGNSLCIYGNAGYPLRRYLQTPFHGSLTQQQKDFNEAMSKVRVSVEWLFGDIIKKSNCKSIESECFTNKYICVLIQK